MRRLNRKFLALLGSWSILALTAYSTQAQPVLGPELRITTGSGRQVEPDVAFSGQTAIAVWTRTQSGPSFAGWGMSTDGGATWTNGGTFLPSGINEVVRGRVSICSDDQGVFYVSTAYDVIDQRTIAIYKGQLQGGGMVWQPPQFALPPLPTYPNNPYDYARLSCDPGSGTLYLTYTRVEMFPAGSGDFHTIVYVTRSTDQGMTWSPPMALSNDACNGASGAVGPDGEFVVIWVDYQAREVQGRASVDQGQSFSSLFTVAPAVLNLGYAPPGYVVDTSRRNAVYDACTNLLFPSFPAIAIDRTSGVSRGRIYVTWAEAAETSEGPFLGERQESEPNNQRSQANPVTLGENITGYVISSDFGGADYDFYTFVAQPDKLIKVECQITSVFPALQDPPFCATYSLHCEQSSIVEGSAAYARLSANIMPGLLFSVTSPTTFFLEKNGSGFYSHGYRLFFRELTPLPQSVAVDHRDIVITSSMSPYVSWSSKRRVNNNLSGVDDALPQVGVDRAGQVHVAWYSNAAVSGCGQGFDSYVALSGNGGMDFELPVRLSTVSGKWDGLSGTGGAGNIGDHLGLILENGKAFVLWTQQGRPDADIYVRSLQLDEPVATAPMSFAGYATSTGVQSEWASTVENYFSLFRLYRADSCDPSAIGVLVQEVFAGNNGKWHYFDPKPPVSSNCYTLEGVTRDATTLRQSVTIKQFSGSLQMVLLSPNPFRKRIEVALTSNDADGRCNVSVFDVFGRAIRTLNDQLLTSTRETISWDATNEQGRLVPVGMYFLRAEQGGHEITLKIVRAE